MMRFLEPFPVPLLFVDETNSTNSCLHNYCVDRQVAEFSIVMTNFQTAGRGQRGNSWESEREKNLLFSIIFFPTFLEARDQFLLSQIISLSIKEALDTYTKNISIKWPNDIYWCEKKICGMLIENDLTGQHITQSIAGIGININQQFFSSLAPNPVSLYQITGKEHDLLLILEKITQRIKDYYTLLKTGKKALISQRYKEALFRKKGIHLYSDAEGTFQAEIADIKPDGSLILKDEAGGERKYAFKEVQYIL